MIILMFIILKNVLETNDILIFSELNKKITNLPINTKEIFL
jgi:hypothetical protein